MVDECNPGQFSDPLGILRAAAGTRSLIQDDSIMTDRELTLEELFDLLDFELEES